MTTIGEVQSVPEGGSLLAHLLRFGRLLRLMGVQVTLSQVLDLIHALDFVPLTNRQDFYHTTRAILVSRAEELPLFEQAFALYWQRPQALDSSNPTPPQSAKPLRLPPLPSLNPDGVDDPRETPINRHSYSMVERLREKDFAEMSWEEVEEAKRAIARMRWQIRPRLTRRVRSAKRGTRLELRGMVRNNLRFGGEPLTLRWRVRKERRRPLVVLCDISGSMEGYTRLLLHFVHAVSQRIGEVDVFLFGTRLTRITHHLRHKEIDTALDEVAKSVRDWSGGTRIGEALKHFNYRWARRVLGRGAVVLFISDGWDRGEAGLLAYEVSRLQRSAYRLIWLNPLLGSEGYQPVQKGMAAALPFVDDFLPVHNLRSLSQLADALGNLRAGRPERRQRGPIAPPEGTSSSSY